jgi:hypothetical protein
MKDSKFPVLVTASFQCKHHGRLSYCDKTALINGITSYDSVYDSPHTEVETCAERVHVQLDFGRPVRIKQLVRWLYWKEQENHVVDFDVVRMPRQYCNQSVSASVSGEFSGEETVLFECSTYADCGNEDVTGSGRMIAFEPIMARYVRYYSSRNNLNAGMQTFIHMFLSFFTRVIAIRVFSLPA